MYKLSAKKLHKPFSNKIDEGNFFYYVKKVLQADKPIFITAITYGVIISILSLATPICVQLLINSVAFTALFQPILVLGFILLILVGLYGLANILQFHVSEIFQRRFFARMGYEVGMSLLNANHRDFEEANQTELVNRFFETMAIQKTIPKLLNKTFTTFFQSIISLLLIACYHPFFLVFTIGIPFAVYVVWKTSASKAIEHQVIESRRKYDLIGWFEDIARNHLLFKSSTGRDYAKYKIDFITGLYLEERKKHFRYLFRQVISLFILYALATTLLLVMGGWLFLKGQLSLGQLVASELIISAILYNIATLGRDFENFYDLIASSEKLSQFQNIPRDHKKNQEVDEVINEVCFERVLYRQGICDFQFDLNFLKGKNYLLFTNGYSTKKIIIEMLLGLTQPISGMIAINTKNLNDLDAYQLRSQIAVIDNSPFIEGTLREYLTFNHENISQNYIMIVLENVGLAQTILNHSEGIDLRILPNGWPFSESEKILLKIARALIHKPQIIIADEVLDMLAEKIRQKVLTYLTLEHRGMFLYFSHRYDNLDSFENKIFIEKNFSKNINDLNDLNQFIEGQ